MQKQARRLVCATLPSQEWDGRDRAATRQRATRPYADPCMRRSVFQNVGRRCPRSSPHVIRPSHADPPRVRRRPLVGAAHRVIVATISERRSAVLEGHSLADAVTRRIPEARMRDDQVNPQFGGIRICNWRLGSVVHPDGRSSETRRLAHRACLPARPRQGRTARPGFRREESGRIARSTRRQLRPSVCCRSAGPPPRRATRLRRTPCKSRSTGSRPTPCLSRVCRRR